MPHNLRNRRPAGAAGSVPPGGPRGQRRLDLGAVVVRVPDRDLRQAPDPAVTGGQVGRRPPAADAGRPHLASAASAGCGPAARDPGAGWWVIRRRTASSTGVGRAAAMMAIRREFRPAR